MFTSLRTAAFRNLADGETSITSRDVFLVGENGQGKTNFLEALYFCAYASSFRGVKDTELARAGEKDFSAGAELYPAGTEPAAAGRDSASLIPETPAGTAPLRSAILVKYEKTHKTITLDGKKIEDRKDLLDTIPCVVFCHEDMEFVAGSQERRRWFFDQTQSLHDPVYLNDLRRYRRVLKNRNAVLKDYRQGITGRAETGKLLDALDSQLAGYGIPLMEKRTEAAARFSAVFGSLYGEVSGIHGISVAYSPSWKLTPADTPAAAGHLWERREADLAQNLTTTGPHRDRYLFVRHTPTAAQPTTETDRADRISAEFSGTASTGQRRLLALLLRVAQARCFSAMTGKTPVLLLDDVLLELDGEKRRRFLSVMPDYRQAFFTFLPEEPYNNYRKPDTIVYTVHAGTIKTMKQTEKPN